MNINNIKFKKVKVEKPRSPIRLHVFRKKKNQKIFSRNSLFHLQYVL